MAKIYFEKLTGLIAKLNIESEVSAKINIFLVVLLYTLITYYAFPGLL